MYAYLSVAVIANVSMAYSERNTVDAVHECVVKGLVDVIDGQTDIPSPDSPPSYNFGTATSSLNLTHSEGYIFH